jgi:transposase
VTFALLEADLLRAGHRVVRVPTRLMATARRSGRQPGKSDPIDALAVVQAALREPDLPAAHLDGPTRQVKHQQLYDKIVGTVVVDDPQRQLERQLALLAEPHSRGPPRTQSSRASPILPGRCLRLHCDVAVWLA